MSISDQRYVLFLGIGVVIGIIYTLNKSIIAIFGIKKLGNFFFDFTFAAATSMLTFIGALCGNQGTLRLLQVLTELLGAVSFYYALGDAFLFLMQKICKTFASAKAYGKTFFIHNHP